MPTLRMVQYLESLQRAGLTHLPHVAAALAAETPASTPLASANPPSQAPPQNPTMPKPVRSAPTPPRKPAAPVAPPKARPAESPLDGWIGADRTLDERTSEFERLCGEVRECRLCPVLVANRTQTVFGVGNLRPRLCFFGEAPGADEDAQGEPFVGRAGQLLDKMIEAMTLRRSDVYILNVLKCRPPDNRAPIPDEVENCRSFFEEQLNVLRPEYVCCLGATAAQTLLRTKLSIGKLRGRLIPQGSMKVLATYHPAYLLRNPSAKANVWDDLKVLMADMGLKVR